MGLLRWLSGGSFGRDSLKLEIMMDATAPIRARGAPGNPGRAALRWTDLGDASVDGTVEERRITLTALHYARILAVHSETRSELFEKVESAARLLIQEDASDPLKFPAWNLSVHDPVGIVGDSHFPIWPWMRTTAAAIEGGRSSAAVGCPVSYIATLKIGEGNACPPPGYWIHLEMPMRQAKLLAPSSVLVSLALLSADLEPGYRRALALVLLFLNKHVGTPDKIHNGREGEVVGAALQELESRRSELGPG